MLKVIKIENIKGIREKKFELEISPNKPSLLVAPNGFGKSSIATAFNSMNGNRIVLKEDDYYLESDSNLPKITIEYTKMDGTNSLLEATSTSNTISNAIDCFVINNQTKPKGIGSQYGRASATLEIKDVVLVDKIPTNTSFGYSYRNSCDRFGFNSKVLPNLNMILSNLKLISCLSENYIALERAEGDRIKGKINLIIEEINLQQGAADILIGWILTNKLENLRQIEYLNTIGNLISDFDLGYDSDVKNYLAAIQLIWLFNQNPVNFKNACIYSNYKFDKEQFDLTLSTFNCTWKNIRSSENGGKLLVKFPKAIHISNGQRDILTFISMLFRAKRSLKKPVNILVIDEVFDYLDDANLTAAQYYITSLIKDFADNDKQIYPLILTHLNPSYFKNFAFSKQKVYYLDKTTIEVSPNLIKLLRSRKNPTIEDDVSKLLLHFHPNSINKRAEFRALAIPELWGESNNFVEHLNSEILKYLNNDTYDPFAVCGALRIKIEEIAFNKIQSEEAQNAFLETHTTRKKLEKAEEMGVMSPESHFLLGIIYNEGMHWKDNQDNVSPIASKLENLVIKKIIGDVFN